MADNYEDIINLPHHVSKKRKRMSQIDRAAQFSPFAALTGYDAAILETGRLTDKRVELDEGTKAILNEKLTIIADFIKEQPEVTITYFEPDTKKDGGAYVDYTGTVRRIDEYERAVIMTDKTSIPIEQIYNIQCELFGNIEFE